MKLPIIHAVLLNLLAHSVNGYDDLQGKGYEYMGQGYTKDGKYPAFADEPRGNGNLNNCVYYCQSTYKEKLVAIVVHDTNQCACNYGPKGGERYALDLRYNKNNGYTYQKIETVNILGYDYLGRGYSQYPKYERVHPSQGGFLNCMNQCESQFNENLVGFSSRIGGDMSCYCMNGNSDQAKTYPLYINKNSGNDYQFRTFRRTTWAGKKNWWSKDLIPPTTQVPTKKPTDLPTKNPTNLPTKYPTNLPTKNPTNLPSKKPTKMPTKKPTNLPSKKPTKVPTKKPTNLPSKKPTKTPTAMPSGAQGDPHFITWSNNKFDFHGVCDLVMLSNEKFENSFGMEIHIRTKKMLMWSYISVLAIRIGNSILEVIGEDGGSYIMNGIVHQGKDDGLMMFSGYPIVYSKKNKKQQTFRLNLGNLEAIVIKTWNSFVSVHFENPKSEHFEDSTGLMGSFPDGVLLARDNLTIIDDANRFGQEWQVMETEKTLFHQVQGPQQPLKKCEIPSNLDMRRLLGEKTITEEKAQTACIGVEANSIDLCIFDVMATSNLSTAGAY